ncbi:MAG: phosphotransferase [Planctomycetes bacterium]|nr:phosphotransferase [Planctomycetota bacterium]
MNAKPWTPDIPFNAALAEALVYSQFPEFAGLRAEFVGEGWDTSVWRFGDVAFRFPHREVGVIYLDREAKLMPWLAPQLSLPVPAAHYFGKPSERFPRPFIGVNWVEGTPSEHAKLNDEHRAAIAAPLGQFLAALHQIPAGEALQRCASRFNRAESFERWMQGCFQRLDEIQGTELGFTCAPIRAALEAAEPFQHDMPQYLTHCDLYLRHILFDDDKRLCGVIDWGDVCVSDRAADFELVFGFMPPSARADFFEAYHQAGGPEIDAATLERARLISLTTILNVGSFSIDIQNRDLIDEIILSARWIGL